MMPAPITVTARHERLPELRFTPSTCVFLGPWPRADALEAFQLAAVAVAKDVFGHALGITETFEITGQDTPEYSIRFVAYVLTGELARLPGMVEAYRNELETWL